MINEIIIDLKALKISLERVPKNVAPSEDKELYLGKALEDLKVLILKYMKLKD